MIKSDTPMNMRAAPQRVKPDGQEFLALYQEHLQAFTASSTAGWGAGRRPRT